TLPLYARTPRAEALPSAVGSRDYGQREAHSREPRYRHPTGRSTFLPSRWLGPIIAARISRLRTVRRRRPDHSVEFSASDAAVEDCACVGNWKYGCAETCGVHAAYRLALC